MKTLRPLILPVAIALLVASRLPGTETENLGCAILPASGQIIIDGQTADWDLSGGIFATSDAENMREKAAVWFHAMYDDKYLYLLARFSDDTPLNNPGETAADHGFNGDSLQVRWIVGSETPAECGGHITAWHGRDNLDVVLIQKGKTFKDGEIKDAKRQGVLQAFSTNDDHRGYVQELAIPWALLTKNGQALHAGDRMQLTIEPNFTLRGKARLTIKDIFKPNMPVDRIFTFMSWQQWGPAVLEKQGHIAPPPVRLADGREFAVRLDDGVPMVDWTGLIKGRELKGFKTIPVDVPADGVVSLNILDNDGVVVRQLLNGEFLTKGTHQIKWDGLTNYSVKKPGEAVPPGEYHWSALFHPQFGLHFRGWACNSGNAPWDGPSGKNNWGGDHGVPVGCATESEQVFLVWSGAEGGKMLVAANLRGELQWGKNFTTMGGLSAVAVDQGAVYVSDGKRLSRVSAADGSYMPWQGGADIVLAELNKASGAADLHSLAAREGKVYLSYAKLGAVLVVDVKSGQLQKTLQVDNPESLCVAPADKLYVVSAGKNILVVDPDSGEAKTLISGLAHANGIAVDQAGNIFVAVSTPSNQVTVFDSAGIVLRTLGRAGGRATLGPWTPEGMAFVKGIAVDVQGQVWAAEADAAPKRVSVWDSKTGDLLNDFFGPPPYASTGGAILPADPNVMVGSGCEWRMDPQTGKSKCVAVITRDGMANSRFALGANGKTYLAVANEWAFSTGPVKVFERVGEGRYKLRARFDYETQNAAAKKTIYWADQNGDELQQENERTTLDGALQFSAWWMRLAQDLSICTDSTRIEVRGFTDCGSPQYDFMHATKIPQRSSLSSDGRLALQGGDYGTEHGVMRCYDVATGKQLWTYPDNFIGVHGSHKACGPAVGMIRGSYTPVASVKLPEPVGNIWVIPTNLGEWHILSQRGFYLGKIFEGDPLRVKLPDEALPGASMDSVPPGGGQEDFGGNIALAPDGKFYVQAGSSAFWNIELTGLDQVVAIPGGNVAISSDDIKLAQAMRASALQTNNVGRAMAIKKMTPTFTGNLDADFRDAQIVSFSNQEGKNLRAAAAWDKKNLHLAWQVDDVNPWLNAADAPEVMYFSGDTVDFQLATDLKAAADRDKAALGDVRLSIGNFKGTPTAVLYRMVAADKQPKVFNSGVIKNYTVDNVTVLPDAKIKLHKGEKSYVIEATVPLASLGITAVEGAKLRGDIGATFGDASGKRTGLRTYWSNQHTGIVDDVVFELMLEPQYWGELTFSN